MNRPYPYPSDSSATTERAVRRVERLEAELREARKTLMGLQGVGLVRYSVSRWNDRSSVTLSWLADGKDWTDLPPDTQSFVRDLLDRTNDYIAKHTRNKPRQMSLDEHPEGRCGRCGGRNIVWSVDSDRFNTAVNRSEIVCPTCFVFAHECATGMRCRWELVPSSPFQWIEGGERQTPFMGLRENTGPEGLCGPV